MNMSRQYSWASLLTLCCVITASLFQAGFASVEGQVGTDESVVPLISTGWLAEHLDDSNLVLLHIGGRDEYDEGHIPGARHVDRELTVIRSARGLHNELPPVAHLDSVFEYLGVSNESHIVLYPGERALSSTTRTFFTLEYLGLGNRTSILNGGLDAWLAEDRQTTTSVVEVAQGSITPHPRPEIVVHVDWLNANLSNPNLAIFDARGPGSYSGEAAGSYPRPGHIAGASNLPYSSLVESGTAFFHSTDSLRTIFENAGVVAGDSVIGYCGTGIAASALYFVANFLGYEAAMYDAAFEEWSAREDLPVERNEPQ